MSKEGGSYFDDQLYYSRECIETREGRGGRGSRKVAEFLTS